jgi:hypothetical protein
MAQGIAGCKGMYFISILQEKTDKNRKEDKEKPPPS